MNEASFWRWMTDRLPPGAYSRIESPISPGVPDVNYSLDNGVHGWIELKIAGRGTYPFLAERRGLRPAQALWIDERVKLRTSVVIIAYMAPAVVVWRLKPGQSFEFNTWDRQTLLNQSVWSLKRRLVRGIPLDRI